MEYQQALDYIYSFVDYETQRMPRDEAHFDLRRMDELMLRLGNPHLAIPSVHIAGTNGKGSTAAMIASVMTVSGYTTGLNTSPHLVDLRERIMIDGKMISEAELIALTEKLKPEVEAVNQKGTYGQLTTFEIMTAMAFDYFKQKGCDFQVIEVGMGGRLDATNIIIPEVSVITSISYDHTEVLGKTLTDIARQKAGIIKPDSVVVSHPQSDEAMRVIAGICIRFRTKLLQVGIDVFGERLSFDLDGQRLRIKGRQGSYDVLLPLLGHYQLDNAAASVAALEVLAEKGYKVTHDSIVRGLAQVDWPGRFQVLSRQPPVVVDGGHNPGAVSQLKQSLEAYFGLSQRGKVNTRDASIQQIEHSILVMGASFDKDAVSEIKELSPLFDRVIVTRANHPRAAATASLVAEFAKHGIKPLVTESVSAAMSQALNMAGDQDLICVGGSLFVVGEAIDYFAKLKPNDTVRRHMMTEPVGYRVIGTIKKIKGTCSWGHKVGDKFELSGYSPDGLCGFFYHDIYPYIIMLQFGGKFPEGWGGEVLQFECMDRANAVRIELRPEKPAD
jgi:dihydrofolate synthase/folylpolyglutamate synthase